MNKKGFAITGVLYSVLILFLVITSVMLFNMQNKKTLLDKLKSDTVNAVESDANYDYLISEINTLKSKVSTLEEENSSKDTEIQNLKTTVNSLSTDNTSNKNNITSHTNTLSTHTTSINSLTSSLNTLNSRFGFSGLNNVNISKISYGFNTSNDNPYIMFHTDGGYFFILTFNRGGAINLEKIKNDWSQKYWGSSNSP